MCSNREIDLYVQQPAESEQTTTSSVCLHADWGGVLKISVTGWHVPMF